MGGAINLLSYTPSWLAQTKLYYILIIGKHCGAGICDTSKRREMVEESG